MFIVTDLVSLNLHAPLYLVKLGAKVLNLAYVNVRTVCMLAFFVFSQTSLIYNGVARTLKKLRTSK